MVLDVVFAVVMIFCVYLGFKRGFVKSVCNVTSFALSVVVAFLSYHKISEFITLSPVGKYITDKISTTVSITPPDLSGMPDFTQKPLQSITDASLDAVNTVSQNFAAVIIGIISVIITIIIVKLAIKLLFKIFDFAAKLPVIRQCNGIMGGVFGVISGVFWVCIIAFVLTYISVIPKAQFLQEIIETSRIMPFVCENNFLLALIPKS